MQIRSFFLPNPQWLAIRREAKRKEISASELMRRIIDRYLEQSVSQIPEKSSNTLALKQDA